MKTLILAAAGAAALSLCAQATLADQWVDYTPVKGTYVKTLVHVEPNRIDDYLVALKKTWVPTEESAKKHGVIDSYMVQVNLNPYTSGPNVILIEHYPSMATMDPEKTRDMAMDKEAEQFLPKAQLPSVSAERAKYRTILSQEMWSVIDFK